MEDLKSFKREKKREKEIVLIVPCMFLFVILNGFRIRSRLVLPVALVRYNKVNKNSIDVCERVCLHHLYIIFRGE